MIIFNRKLKEYLMTIEHQVSALQVASAEMKASIEALTEKLNASTVPTIVDTSSLSSAIADLDAKLSTVLADITDPSDKVAVEQPTETTTAEESAK